MTRSIRIVILLIAGLAAGCRSGALAPADFDVRHEVCRFCRMSASDGRTAAQLVSPRNEPLFFDDIGCLRDFLKGSPEAATEAVAYVVDHRTREWVRADAAIYVRVDSAHTPMGSHLFAHASRASREADEELRGGVALTFSDVFSGTALGGLSR